MAAIANQPPMQPTPPKRGSLLSFLEAIQEGADSKKFPLEPLHLNALLKADEGEVKQACAAILNAEWMIEPGRVLPAAVVSSIAHIGGCAIIRKLESVRYEISTKVLKVAESHSSTPRDALVLFHIAMWRGYVAGKIDKAAQLYRGADVEVSNPVEHYLEALHRLDQLGTLHKTNPHSQVRIAPLGNLARLLRGDVQNYGKYEDVCKELDSAVNQFELAPSQSVVNGLYELGIYFSRKKQPERALEVLHRSEQYADLIEYHAAQVEILEYLGDVYGWIGSTKEASDAYFKAASVCRMLPDGNSTRICRNRLATKFRSATERMGTEIDASE
jgi:hypothetical protein